MAGDHRLPTIKIAIARDPSISGYLTYNARSCDIAAPLNRNNTPWPGEYKLVRWALIPQSDRKMYESYGPVVLYYATKSGLTTAIHGGMDPEPDRLFNPDFGLAMHNSDLSRLADAVMHGNASQSLVITMDDVGWWRRKFRTAVVARHKPRMSPDDLHTPLHQMRLVRRPQHGDDELRGDQHFWIAIHRDHQDEEAASPSPFVPGDGEERGAGVTGSFDDAEPKTTIRDLFDSGKVTVGDDGRLTAGRAVAAGVVAGAAASLALNHGTAKDIDPEDAARTERARQFVFGDKPNPLAIGAKPFNEEGTASSMIDNGARIIANVDADDDADKSGSVEASAPVSATVEAETSNDDKQESSSDKEDPPSEPSSTDTGSSE